jgi:hypothetical protein
MPTATSTTTQPPSGNSLPLTGFADDYLMWANWNGLPSHWQTPNAYYQNQLAPTGVMQLWKCNTARLSFTFPDDPGVVNGGSCPQGGNWGSASTLDYAKMNQVLNIMSSIGVKVVPYDFSSFGLYYAGSHWYGSQAWANDWLALATAFKGDTRIEAFQLCSEPQPNFCSPTGPTGGIREDSSGHPNAYDLDAALKYLIDQIHSIDSSRKIMFPNMVGICVPNAAFSISIESWLADLDTKGITAKSYVLYDIVHPYYFEDYPNMDTVNNPVGDADWIWNNYCLPQIAHFGSSKCWSGETFPWSRYNYIVSNPALGYFHYDLQQQFEVAMINHFVSVGMGFQMLCFFSTDHQAFIDALTKSNYYTLIHR